MFMLVYMLMTLVLPVGLIYLAIKGLSRLMSRGQNANRQQGPHIRQRTPQEQQAIEVDYKVSDEE
jgi:hypothetical protein